MTAETFDNSGRTDLTSEKYHSDPLAELLTPFLLCLSATDRQFLFNSFRMLTQSLFQVNFFVMNFKGTNFTLLPSWQKRSLMLDKAYDIPDSVSHILLPVLLLITLSELNKIASDAAPRIIQSIKFSRSPVTGTSDSRSGNTSFCSEGILFAMK